MTQNQQQIAAANGKQQRRTDIPPLPEHRRKEAESFFANYVAREDELAHTKDDLEAAHIRISQLETINEELRSRIAMLESRAASCVAERDEAVAFRTQRETVLTSIQHLLQQAGVPPIVEHIETEMDHG
jgi:predicted RNase H-like nuclease (RuvC/YqgF family)